MRDEARLQWVRKQPCAVCGCPGPNHAHHSTSAVGEDGRRRGKGQKAADSETLALCLKHHKNLHELSGFFSGYTKNEIREWQDVQVRLHTERYEAELAARSEPAPTRDEAGKELGVDILAGGSTDPRELAENLARIHGLAPLVQNDIERAMKHLVKGAR